MRKILNSPIQGSVAWAIYIALLVFGAIALTLSSGCKTSEKLVTDQAAKDEKARQEEMALLEKMRQKYPCAPGQIVQGKTVYLPSDSLPCPADTRHGDRANPVYVKCPDRAVRVDTLKVIDSSMIQSYRDSLDSERYAGDIARQDANDQAQRADEAEARLNAVKDEGKVYKRIVYISGAILAALVGAVIFQRLKALYEQFQRGA